MDQKRYSVPFLNPMWEVIGTRSEPCEPVEVFGTYSEPCVEVYRGEGDSRLSVRNMRI